MCPHFSISRTVPLILVLGMALALVAWSDARSTPEESEETPRRLTTLYALDPIATSLDFETGEYGGVITDHKKYSRKADIDFSSYFDGEFRVGIGGGLNGVILDLGTADELKEKYGYTETVGGGQGFASIRFQGRSIVILKDYATGGVTLLREARALFDKPTDDSSHLPVKSGHIYLVRITDPRDRKYELTVKMIVVAHKPGEFATIRWDVL